MAYSKKIPHGIMFHHFHNEKHIKSQGSISQEDFKRILDYVRVSRFISPLEWLDKLSKKQLTSGDLCLTFDDGLLSQAEVALPVLEHFRLQAFWFVYSSVFDGNLANLEIYRFFRTNYFTDLDTFYRLFFSQAANFGFQTGIEGKVIEEQRKSYSFYSENDVRFRLLRDKVLGKENYEKIMDSILEEYGINKSDLARDLWMSDKDLEYLNDAGHIIGLHSYSHPTALADLSFQEQLAEYQKNFSHLERVCGKKPIAMSHPCNSYNEDTLRILNQLGIRCGFRANILSGFKAVSLNASDLEIAREDHAHIMATLQS